VAAGRDGLDDLAVQLATASTRRSALGRVALGAVALLGLGATRAEARRKRRAPRLPGTEPIPGGWYGFCGHYFTTGSCPGPHRLPRIDRNGLPLRPHDGRAIDNLGRLVDTAGLPVDERGRRLIGPDGDPLPRAPRTRICEDWVPERFSVDADTQGSWYRCCDGRVRRLVDCCSTSRRRINGDAALRGYCVKTHRVFCVMYQDLDVPC
jgi:hypothetical protein